MRKGLSFQLTRLLWGFAGPAYRYQGCYAEYDLPSRPYTVLGQLRSLPQVHNNFRVGSVEDCAAAARIKGFPMFALQWYGECFFGSMADVARLQASPQKLPDDNCALLPCPAGAAICPGNINKIFVLIGAHTWPLLQPNVPTSLCCLPGQEKWFLD